MTSTMSVEHDARFEFNKDPRFKRLPTKKRKVVLDDRFSKILDDKTQFGGVLKDPRTGKAQKQRDQVHQLKSLYVKPKKQKLDVESREFKEIKHAVPKKFTSDVSPDFSDSQDNDLDDSNQSDSDLDDNSSFQWDVSASSDDSDYDDAEWDRAIDTADLASEANVWTTPALEATDMVCCLKIYSGLWFRLLYGLAVNVPYQAETVSSRLEILGCDWDNVTSEDLFILLNSFCAKIGKINRVAVYLSDFGHERMDHENCHGPVLPSLAEKPATPKSCSAEDVASEESKETAAASHEKIGESQFEEHQDNKLVIIEALRKYQKERTKYYFAVVECDSVKTASYLYDELENVDCDFALDGLDLRFIPDDLPPFTQTYPRAPCCQVDEKTMTGSHYKAPTAAFASALRHTKVRCTWDETPAARTKQLKRKRFDPDELMELDLKEYLASDEDEDDEEVEAGELDSDIPHSLEEKSQDGDTNEKPSSAGSKRDRKKSVHKAACKMTIDDIELPKTLTVQQDCGFAGSSKEERQIEKKAVQADAVATYRSQLLQGLADISDDDRQTKISKFDTPQTLPSAKFSQGTKIPFDLSSKTDFEITFNDVNDTSSTNLENLGVTSSAVDGVKLGPWEAYLQRKKLERKARKQESKLRSTSRDASENPVDAIKKQKVPAKVRFSECSTCTFCHVPQNSNKKKAFPIVGVPNDTLDPTTSKSSVGEIPHNENGGSTNDDFDSEDGLFSTKEPTAAKKSDIRKQKKKQYKKSKNSLGDDRVHCLEKTVDISIEKDPRFSAMLVDPTLAVDTTNPHFKKSKAYDKLFEEKLAKKRARKL